MIFNKESDFEAALIKILSEKGWEKEVLKNYSEQDLLRNWANILFENNRDIDRLNDYPLTNSEMQQILEQIETLRTPLKLNGFINGKSVSIVRDNPDDKLHFGKEVSLKIYDRREIAAGQSRYQIVQQPKFPTKSKLLNDRRGDLMLLINGMPVIHIELKKSGIQSSALRKTIDRLSSELDQKATMIVALQEDLAKKNVRIQELDEMVSSLNEDVESLATTAAAQSEKLNAQDKALHTAYYCFGTSKELKEQKILSGGGLFSKSKVLQSGFNKDYFISIDIREVKEIPLFASKAKLKSNHPEGSYEFVEDEDGNLTLKINDEKAFWSLGKYLVIEVG